MTDQSSHPLLEHFRMLSRFNTLANRRVYEAAALLPADELRAPRAGHTASISRLLHHLLISDRVWMTRFSGGHASSTGLHDVLYASLEDLHAARMELDERIEVYFRLLSPENLNGSIRYINNRGNAHKDPVPVLFAHFFNHQTHHRAQINSMFKQTAVAPPVIDLHRIMHPEPVSDGLSS